MSALLISAYSLGASQNPVEFIIPKSSAIDINQDDYYFRVLLTLIFDKTVVDYGPYSFKEFAHWTADKRLHSTIAQGDIDIAWSVTSVELEQALLPVRVSLLKSLSNYRVLLIRKGDQQRFNSIYDLNDLRNFVGGMGAQWPDTEVMKFNKLPLVTATGYGKFYKMLAAGRYDYFSRGLYQAHSDVNFYPELQLQIEENLLLYYPNHYYFFVNKSNPGLAARIKEGLDIVEADGSFDLLFHSIPRFKWAATELLNGNRRIIPLVLPPTNSNQLVPEN